MPPKKPLPNTEDDPIIPADDEELRELMSEEEWKQHVELRDRIVGICKEQDEAATT